MIGKRRYGIVWEYDGDGRFPQERWNKSDKRYWKRWLRRVGKEELKDAIQEVYEGELDRGGSDEQFICGRCETLWGSSAGWNPSASEEKDD